MKSDKIKGIITLALTATMVGNSITPVIAAELSKSEKQEVTAEEKELEENFQIEDKEAKDKEEDKKEEKKEEKKEDREKENNYTDYINGYMEENLAINVASKESLIDNEDPILSSISINSNKTKVGEKIKVEIDAVDHGSGIREVIYSYEINIDEYYSVREIELVENKSTGKFEGYIDIIEECEGKILTPQGVTITDNASNRAYFHKGQDNNLKIWVADKNGMVDNENPIFNEIKIDKNKVKIGEEVLVSIDAEDKDSGIEEVKYRYKTDRYAGPGDYKELILTFNDKTSKYEGKILITKEMENKKIYPNGIYIKDKFGNEIETSRYDYEGLIVYITDENGEIDETPPTIVDVTIDRTEVAIGEPLVISVEATDDSSGIKEVNYEYSVGHSEEAKYYNLKLDLNRNTGRYEGIIPVTEDIAGKIITPQQVAVTDKCGNTQWRYDELSTLKVWVKDKNGALDKEAPKVSKVSVDKKQVAINDEVIVEVDATDNLSGVRKLEYIYNVERLYGSEQKKIELKFDEKTNKYKGQIKITEDMESAKIRPEKIFAEDFTGNYEYYSDFVNDNLIIYVENKEGIVDREPPKLISIKADKNEAVLNDRIKIKARAEDNKSGIAEIIYKYSYGNNYEELLLELNKDTGNYEGEILITEKLVGKTINPDFVKLTDKVGNYEYSYNYNYEDLVIAVANENGVIDKTEPIIKSVSIDKKEAAVNDRIKITVDAKDNETSIKNVEASYKIKKGFEEEYAIEKLTLNKATGKYEGEIVVKEEMAGAIIELEYVAVSDESENEAHKFLDGSLITWIKNKDGIIDKESPIIKSFKVDKEIASVGEKVKLEVEAIDGKSGIDSIKANISYEDGFDEVTLKYNSKTKKYEAEIMVDEYFYGDEMVIYHLSVVDKNSNISMIYTHDALVVKIKDINGEVNSSDVKIESLTVDKTKVKVGDTVNVELKLKDKKVKNKSIEFNYYMDGVSSSNESVYLSYDEKSASYKGNFEVGERFNNGKIDYHVYLYNSKGESDMISSKEINKSITVENNSNIDINNQLPRIKRVYFNKSNIKVGEKLKISAEVEGENIRKVSALINDKIEFGTDIDFKYNKDSKVYEGYLDITEDMKYKKLFVDYIWVNTIDDKESNYNNEDLNIPAINVIGEDNKIDDIAPTLVKATIDKELVSTGTDVKLSLSAKDDKSGIKSIKYYYRNSNDFKMVELNYDNNSKNYEAIIKTDNYIEGDTLRAEFIAIEDNAGNVARIRSGIDNLNIKVKGKNGLIKENKDIITDISLSKNLVNKHERIKLSTKLNVDPKEISKVTIAYNINGSMSGYEKKQALTYNEGTKSYETEIGVHEIVNDKGEIIMESIRIVYKNGESKLINLSGRNDLVILYSPISTGWKKVNGRYSYYKAGKVVKGKEVIDGKTYIFNNYGEFEKIETSNEKPVINAKNITIKQGDKLNLLESVTATDKEDGNLTSKVVVKSQNVDTSKVGIYKVVYEVKDSNGNITTKEITVTVKLAGKTDFESHWAKNEIDKAMESNWINASNNFRPNDAITRAEFIKIVNKAFGYKNNKVVEKFTDVDKSHWFYNEINIALNAGYISSSNSKFRPNDLISREEVASIVTSIKNKKDSNLDKIKKLTDYNKISSWARTSVEGSIEAGYMGKGGTTFRPKDNITRAEAITTLSRIK